MSKKQHVGNSWFKVLRDVHSFFQDEGLKYNQAIRPHTALPEHVRAALKITDPTVSALLKEFQTCNSLGRKPFY
jgi:hypothetical protein